MKLLGWFWPETDDTPLGGLKRLFSEETIFGTWAGREAPTAESPDHPVLVAGAA